MFGGGFWRKPLSFLGFGDMKIWVLDKSHCWEKPKADDSLQIYPETGVSSEEITGTWHLGILNKCVHESNPIYHMRFKNVLFYISLTWVSVIYNGNKCWPYIGVHSWVIWNINLPSDIQQYPTKWLPPSVSSL